MKMETEIRVIWPQAKEYLELLELERLRKGSPLEPLEEVWPCQHLDFQLLYSKTGINLFFQICDNLL